LQVAGCEEAKLTVDELAQPRGDGGEVFRDLEGAEGGEGLVLVRVRARARARVRLRVRVRVRLRLRLRVRVRVRVREARASACTLRRSTATATGSSGRSLKRPRLTCLTEPAPRQWPRCDMRVRTVWGSVCQSAAALIVSFSSRREPSSLRYEAGTRASSAIIWASFTWWGLGSRLGLGMG
jgi:hypothetical protein